LTNKIQHSNVTYFRDIRGADCNTEHYLVVAKVIQRMLVSKRTT